MSADEYKDCPLCGSKESVGIYYVHDFELHKDGSIVCDIEGRCTKCNQLYCSKPAVN